MKKIAILCGMACVLCGSAFAISGPGGYFYALHDDGTSQSVRSIYIDKNWNCDPDSYQLYTTTIADSHATVSAFTGMPTLYARPESAGAHGSFLVGAYYNGTVSMDTLRVNPQADNTLGITVVHDGKAYAASAFHTQDASQVHYDATGAFTGETDPSILVTNTHTGTRMQDTGPGWATDTDGDGLFDDAGGSTDQYQSLGSLARRSVDRLYGNAIYSPTDHGATGPSFTSGIRITYLSSVGVDNYVNKFYYEETAAAGGGYEGSDLKVRTYTTADPTGPIFDVADTNNNGIADVYWIAMSYGAAGKGAVMHSEDLNGDGDVLSDANETTAIFVFGVDGEHANEVNLWRPSGTANEYLHLVPDNGDGSGWSLLLNFDGAIDYHRNYGFLGVIDLADNGEWGGHSQDIIVGDQGVNDFLQYMLIGNHNSIFIPESAGGTDIPEPATLLLVGTGVLGALGWVRRRRMS